MSEGLTNNTVQKMGSEPKPLDNTTDAGITGPSEKEHIVPGEKQHIAPAAHPGLAPRRPQPGPGVDVLEPQTPPELEQKERPQLIAPDEELYPIVPYQKKEPGEKLKVAAGVTEQDKLQMAWSGAEQAAKTRPWIARVFLNMLNYTNLEQPGKALKILQSLDKIEAGQGHALDEKERKMLEKAGLADLLGSDGQDKFREMIDARKTQFKLTNELLDPKNSAFRDISWKSVEAELRDVQNDPTNQAKIDALVAAIERETKKVEDSDRLAKGKEPVHDVTLLSAEAKKAVKERVQSYGKDKAKFEDLLKGDEAGIQVQVINTQPHIRPHTDGSGKGVLGFLTGRVDQDNFNELAGKRERDPNTVNRVNTGLNAAALGLGLGATLAPVAVRFVAGAGVAGTALAVGAPVLLTLGAATVTAGVYSYLRGLGTGHREAAERMKAAAESGEISPQRSGWFKNLFGNAGDFAVASEDFKAVHEKSQIEVLEADLDTAMANVDAKKVAWEANQADQALKKEYDDAVINATEAASKVEARALKTYGGGSGTRKIEDGKYNYLSGLGKFGTEGTELFRKVIEFRDGLTPEQQQAYRAAVDNMLQKDFAVTDQNLEMTVDRSVQFAAIRNAVYAVAASAAFSFGKGFAVEAWNPGGVHEIQLPDTNGGVPNQLPNLDLHNKIVNLPGGEQVTVQLPNGYDASAMTPDLIGPLAADQDDIVVISPDGGQVRLPVTNGITHWGDSNVVNFFNDRGINLTENITNGVEPMPMDNKILDMGNGQNFEMNLPADSTLENHVDPTTGDGYVRVNNADGTRYVDIPVSNGEINWQYDPNLKSNIETALDVNVSLTETVIPGGISVTEIEVDAPNSVNVQEIRNAYPGIQIENGKDVIDGWTTDYDGTTRGPWNYDMNSVNVMNPDGTVAETVINGNRPDIPPIPDGGSAEFTFTNNSDLGAQGIESLTYWTSLPGPDGHNTIISIPLNDPASWPPGFNAQINGDTVTMTVPKNLIGTRAGMGELNVDGPNATWNSLPTNSESVRIPIETTEDDVVTYTPDITGRDIEKETRNPLFNAIGLPPGLSGTLPWASAAVPVVGGGTRTSTSKGKKSGQKQKGLQQQPPGGSGPGNQGQPPANSQAVSDTTPPPSGEGAEGTGPVVVPAGGAAGTGASSSGSGAPSSLGSQGSPFIPKSNIPPISNAGSTQATANSGLGSQTAPSGGTSSGQGAPRPQPGPSGGGSAQSSSGGSAGKGSTGSQPPSSGGSGGPRSQTPPPRGGQRSSAAPTMPRAYKDIKNEPIEVIQKAFVTGVDAYHVAHNMDSQGLLADQRNNALNRLRVDLFKMERNINKNGGEALPDGYRAKYALIKALNEGDGSNFDGQKVNADNFNQLWNQIEDDPVGFDNKVSEAQAEVDDRVKQEKARRDEALTSIRDQRVDELKKAAGAPCDGRIHLVKEQLPGILRANKGTIEVKENVLNELISGDYFNSKGQFKESGIDAVRQHRMASLLLDDFSITVSENTDRTLRFETVRNGLTVEITSEVNKAISVFENFVSGNIDHFGLSGGSKNGN